MNKMIQAATVAVALLAVPSFGFAAQATAGTATSKTAPATSMPAQKKPMAKAAAGATALHSARGVVTSVDASSLVISQKAGKKAKAHEMRFSLDPSTQKEGSVAVGSTVVVKYHNDAKTHVAADIKASAAKKS